MQITRPIATETAEVMQHPGAEVAPTTAPATSRTASLPIDPRPLLDDRLRQVLDPQNPFTDVRKILPWSHALPSVENHGKAKPEL
jgi:hypothetical protein